MNWSRTCRFFFGSSAAFCGFLAVAGTKLLSSAPSPQLAPVEHLEINLAGRVPHAADRTPWMTHSHLRSCADVSVWVFAE
jgi:hypothetical protein